MALGYLTQFEKDAGKVIPNRFCMWTPISMLDIVSTLYTQKYSILQSLLSQFDFTGFIRERSTTNSILYTLGIQQRKGAPKSTVPFDRDRKFVGREDILTALGSKFSQAGSHNRAALVGLGGVGYALLCSA
jgi:hypothetical protein